MDIIFERLERNDLPLPSYGTEQSAGMDFAACLTRECISHERIPYLRKTKFFPTPPFSRGDMPASHRFDELSIIVYSNEIVLVPLGFKCQFPRDYVLQLHIRSSISTTGLSLANNTAIIDSDYRGEIFAAMINHTSLRTQIKHGERIVQGILLHAPQYNIVEGTVTDTIRGDGGFGSTGK